uniref:ATP synthase subunit a n=1 Tax=Brontispa longissima TaxID=111217 RepID=A0A7T8ZSX4_BROLO|nr:ATP synthase F0 subunit 6 [Brontispa longissima]QQQ89070.1 ATP synthase F0 subunit 6 [Brontispa longissima]UAJ48107.1 ATP synthase F0 subunit 6 [Brontispa longissima]URQ17580.1 ATP synthase F0 subunit 6 [Brontispa longissima]
MMTNLFSSFDPSTIYLSLNWLSLMLMVLLAPSMFWLTPSRLNFFWIKISFVLHKEFKVLTSSSKMKGSTLIFISLFWLILVNNFMGLFPYIFTSTSHMMITLSLALPLWLTFMIKGWVENTFHMFAHLVPQGTPPVLMPFMVCIETISNIIRPGTLAIRLSANMIAGHLLLTLLGNIGPSLNLPQLNILIILQILLLMLEMAVSIIQSYVFTVLTVLYSSEV